MSACKTIEVHNRVSDFNSYRAARVKSLFNAEDGCNFDLTIEADLEGDWQIGVVVGPSGSGKTSIGKVIFDGQNLIHDYSQGWEHDRPIVDCIAPEGDFNEVTGSLASVGLGSVPSWLRPFHVLSNGEQFRAGLARILCEKPARIGSLAFAKAWRRGNPGGKVVLQTPHYDVLEWLEPDWVIDTKTAKFERRLLRRPRFDLEIVKTDSRFWPLFKPHYYLNLPMPPAAEYFVGLVDGEAACHLAVGPFFTAPGYRATRLVTMPEWQGAGVGMRFLNWVAQYHFEGHGRCNRKLPTYFHTSHPQLVQALRRSPLWIQTSAVLYGGNKARCKKSIAKSHRLQAAAGKDKGKVVISGTGYGGHFRAVQGFKYIGKQD